MNLKLAGGAEMMSPVALFMQADIVVKSVMIGLILASIWTWAIIIGHWLRIRKVARENERFERDFWKAQDIDRFHEAHAREEWPSAKIFFAGIAEALFATALGLFAAIPAVIAYNRMTHGINRLEARLGRFADGFHATLSRELEADA